MEKLFGRLSYRSSKINTAAAGLGVDWKCQRCRTMSTSNLMRAKPSKTAPKKAQQKKPLEYKYATLCLISTPNAV
jgi:hypothetical protein